MNASELLPYLNKRRSREMQSLGRELQAQALELEIHGLDGELAIKRATLQRLSREVEALEAERMQLHYDLLRHRAVLHFGGGDEQTESGDTTHLVQD